MAGEILAMVDAVTVISSGVEPRSSSSVMMLGDPSWRRAWTMNEEGEARRRRRRRGLSV